MIKFSQSFLIVILTQVLAVYLFAIFVFLFNLDLFYLFNSALTSFLIQNILIVLIYALITFFINMYFKNSDKLKYKARILGSFLLVIYLLFFYLSNQDINYFKYFLYVHYPVGSYFRTMPYLMFDFLMRVNVLFSIISAMCGVFIGQRISQYKNKKKKSLSSLSKK